MTIEELLGKYVKPGWNRVMSELEANAVKHAVLSVMVERDEARKQLAQSRAENAVLRKVLEQVEREWVIYGLSKEFKDVIRQALSTSAPSELLAAVRDFLNDQLIKGIISQKDIPPPGSTTEKIARLKAALGDG